MLFSFYRPRLVVYSVYTIHYTLIQYTVTTVLIVMGGLIMLECVPSSLILSLIGFVALWCLSLIRFVAFFGLSLIRIVALLDLSLIRFVTL